MKKFKVNIDKEKVVNVVNDLGNVAIKTINELPDKAIEGKKVVEQQYSKAKYDFDKKVLCPVFANDFLQDNLNIPILIRIVDYDKRLENEACKGSIGFNEKIKQETVLHLYSDYALQSGITFYPCLEETFYIADPFRENYYICLDDYFSYLKKAKVNELENIACSLGAKHVKISLKEKKKTFVSHDVKMKAGFKSKDHTHAKTNMQHTTSSDEYTNVEVASELDFNQNDTVKTPELIYFKYESDIQSLIEMRMNNKIKSKTYTFNYNNNHELQEKAAASIDAVIKKLNCNGNSSIVSEVESQKRIVFEYSIEF